MIYFTPGLLLSQCLHVAYVVRPFSTQPFYLLSAHVTVQTLILAPLHRLLIPMTAGAGGVLYPEFSPVKMSTYFVVVIVSAAILTPLEVMSTRLAIQRNQASAEYNSVTQEVEGDAEDVPEYAGAEEDVIGYASSVNCLLPFAYFA
jgi:hypothetical protein